MEKKEQPFETREHDLTGYASLELYDLDNFNSFAARIAGYNPDRFDPVALKVYAIQKEIIVTLYAADHSGSEQDQGHNGRLPVKKFKLILNWDEFMEHFKSFDIVVSDGTYDIDDMVVKNK